jgi:hypothetical protein
MQLLLIIEGDHGWDNRLPVMHPIFIARGPAFKKNYVADPFETVSIYALVCHLLDISPRHNNGSFDSVKQLLVNFEKGHEYTLITAITRNLSSFDVDRPMMYRASLLSRGVFYFRLMAISLVVHNVCTES